MIGQDAFHRHTLFQPNARDIGPTWHSEINAQFTMKLTQTKPTVSVSYSRDGIHDSLKGVGSWGSVRFKEPFKRLVHSYTSLRWILYSRLIFGSESFKPPSNPMYIGSQLRDSVPIVRFREPFKRVGSFAITQSLSHRQTFNSISRSMRHLYLLFNNFIPTQSYYVDSEYVVCFPKYSLLENVSTTYRTSVSLTSLD